MSNDIQRTNSYVGQERDTFNEFLNLSDEELQKRFDVSYTMIGMISDILKNRQITNGTAEYGKWKTR